MASTVSNSPERRQLLVEFVSSEFEEMRPIFYRCLRVIEHAMSARREYMTKEGQIISGGPDHHARLAATKHLRDFLAAGRPAPKQPEKQERRGMTLQELQELVAISEQNRAARTPRNAGFQQQHYNDPNAKSESRISPDNGSGIRFSCLDRFH